MHRKHRKTTEADGADRADEASSEYKVSEAVKVVRTCQNSLGQNGTHLGLLLLLVGPNGDGFGGQAFMEHYSAIRVMAHAPAQWHGPTCGALGGSQRPSH
jgi:hypothetical protein